MQPEGASREVLEHHARTHPCEGGVYERVCPCGATVAIVCAACNEPVFMALADGTWCEHAQELSE